jgi:hypothetical protein
MEQFFEIEVNGRTNNMALRIGEIREDLRMITRWRAKIEDSGANAGKTGLT